MEFLEIAKTIADIGFLVILAAAVIYLLVKYFSAMIDMKVKKGKLSEEAEHIQYDSVSALKELHPYFNKIDSILEVKLPITKIGGPVRTEIFHDTLRIFYKESKEITYNLLDKNITKDNFLSENTKALNNVVKESTEKMREQEIPEIVIEKFWEWNYKKHEYIASTLSDINSSSVFDSIVEKEYAALNLFQSTSYFVLMDAERTLKTLNGDLTGTTYKGKIIESLHYEEEKNDRVRK